MTQYTANLKEIIIDIQYCTSMKNFSLLHMSHSYTLLIHRSTHHFVQLHVCQTFTTSLIVSKNHWANGP